MTLELAIAGFAIMTGVATFALVACWFISWENARLQGPLDAMLDAEQKRKGEL